MSRVLPSEREWDRRLGIRTAGREDEKGTVRMPYEPTPYAVLERLADSGCVRPDDRLLDFGCGKGRVAFFMAGIVGCHSAGLDYADKLIEAAEENRRAFAWPDRVSFSCGQAEKYTPGDESVLYFFNPFSEKIFSSVLRRARGSVKVICYYPAEAYIRCLQALEGARELVSISCGDLFDGRDERERIVLWRVGGG